MSIDVMSNLMFQSTHSRGVRPRNARIIKIVKSFQSTHSRGVRRNITLTHYNALCVSIHALAWSATKDGRVDSKIDACFNPRTRVECDLRLIMLRLLMLMFQSTHSRGVRLPVL